MNIRWNTDGEEHFTYVGHIKGLIRPLGPLADKAGDQWHELRVYRRGLCIHPLFKNDENCWELRATYRKATVDAARNRFYEWLKNYKRILRDEAESVGFVLIDSDNMGS